MTKENSLQEIRSAESNKNIGILMGKAIKDIQVKPDEYASLCIKAKEHGFKFKDIIFVGHD